MESKLYIRFKNIPENEISGVYDGDCGRIRDELGVSCYEFIEREGNYNIILSSINTGFLNDLCGFVDRFEMGEISAYLIEAEQVGIGTCGEPVVKKIKIIRELEIIEFANPKPIFRMDKTNTQLR